MAKQNIKDPGAHHNSSGALIRRFLPYLAKHKAVLFLDLFCAALTTLCDIFLPKIMSTITNSAMGVGITLTTGIVLKLAGIYFVLRIIDGAAQYFMSGIGHIMGVHIETDMRRDAFDHLLLLDHTYYNNTKVGTIMGRITNDLFDVTEFAHHCPEEFFIAFIKILASFIILCQASIPLTLAVFACVPLMGVVSVYLNGRLRARFRQQRIQIGELNATIEDSLMGQGVVKAFAAEEQERAKFEQGNKDFEHIKTLGYYAMAAFNTSTRLFDGLMYLVVILAGGLSLVNGKITAGDLVAYMLYVTTLIATIGSTTVAILAAKLYSRWTAAPPPVAGSAVSATDKADNGAAPAAAMEEGESFPLWVSVLALVGLVGLVPVAVLYGQALSPWIIPGLMVLFLGFGAMRRVRVYEVMVEGGREGFQVALRIIPYMVVILVGVAMLRASGVLDLLVGALGRFTAPLGLPAEALPMALMRPLSGSGAYGIVASLLNDPAVGPDSYTGLLVSTLQGSTETTFYVLAVYFGAVQVKRIRHAMAAALTADLAGVVCAVLACLVLFGR